MVGCLSAASGLARYEYKVDDGMTAGKLSGRLAIAESFGRAIIGISTPALLSPLTNPIP